MTKQPKFSAEFKQEVASRVLDQNYSQKKEACEATAVSDSAMRSGIKQLQAERAGITPQGKTMTPEPPRFSRRVLSS